MTEIIEGNTFETQGKQIQFIAEDGDWYFLINHGVIAETNYKEPNYVARTEGVLDERVCWGFLFTLTKLGNLYMHTTFNHPDNENMLVQSNLLMPVTEIKKESVSAINEGLQHECYLNSDSILPMFVKNVHPSDISPILGYMADLTDYDAWVLEQATKNQVRHNSYKSVERDKHNYVYFIRVPSGITKIGCTRNLQNRIRSIQGMCSEPLTLLGTIETPEQYKVEECLHEYFTDKQVHGEWYDVSTSDIEQATKQLHYDYQVA